MHLRSSQDNSPLIVFGIPLLSGLVLYLILSSLFIPLRILLPVAIIFSALVFGLIKYYCLPINFSSGKASLLSSSTLDKYLENNSEKSKYEDNETSSTGSFFILPYIISIIVVVVLGWYTNRELFLPWEQIDPLQIIQLAAAISISFFMPGYAIISILAPKSGLELLPRILLAYIISIFITGFTIYLTASSSVLDLGFI